MSRVIPENIDPSENLTRCIFHSLHYSKSKQKLKLPAFLPAPNEQDVSVLRRDYTHDDTFCKNHCQSIHMSGQTYVGMAVILAKHVIEVESGNTLGVRIIVRATPLDSNKNKISFNQQIYDTTPGVPTHADIFYSTPARKGKASAEHRILAGLLCRVACAYLDDDVGSDLWTGNALAWEDREA